MPEIEKALAELKRLVEYRKSCGLQESILGLGLTSRRNLCLHPSVSKEKKGKVVDARCRNLTASWVREAALAGQDIETCSFYEELESMDLREQIPDAIYTLDDIKELGRAKKICPYYTARRMVSIRSMFCLHSGLVNKFSQPILISRFPLVPRRWDTPMS